MTDHSDLLDRLEAARCEDRSASKATWIGCAGGLFTLALVFLFILTICGRM